MNTDKNAQSDTDTMPYQPLHDLNPPPWTFTHSSPQVSSTVINSARLIGSLTSFQNTGAMFMQGFPNGLQRGHPWACHGKIVKPHNVVKCQVWEGRYGYLYYMI